MFECPKCHVKYEEIPPFCGECGIKIVSPPSKSTDPLIGTVIDGRYRILDLIGSGGMGSVYRVEHVKMGKVMAMKILHGELSKEFDLVRRFTREAEAVSRLSHINTVSVFDFGSQGELMYLVMEYIDGADLAELLDQQGPLPFVRVAKILIQVCSALIEAHEKGIVHRDLKPGNIFLTQLAEQEDFVKVLDFGLARLRDMQGKTRITAQGSLVGTPFYMAPEHCRDETVDARSDVYALGAVMFKLLTDNTPFTGTTAMAIISQHLTIMPPTPSRQYPQLNIPEAADRIVLKALEKRAENRFQSAEDMRRALADAVAPFDNDSRISRFTSARVSAPSTVPAPPVAPVPTVVEDPPTTGPMLADTAVTPGPSSHHPISHKSVLIGAREVELGTRSDYFNFKKKARRKRLILVLCLLPVLLLVATGGLYWLLLTEREPNNVVSAASGSWRKIPSSGILSSGDDVDWYCLRKGTASTVQVTKVPGFNLNVDLAVEIWQGPQTSPLVANNGGLGVPEFVSLPAGTKCVAVKNATTGVSAPRALYLIVFK